MDSFSRRRFLIETFGILPILMGIQQPNIVTRGLSLPTVISTIRPVDMTTFERERPDFWNRHYTGSGRQAIAEISYRIGALYEALPFSLEQKRGKRLLGYYHILMAAILRDQRIFSDAINHLNKAVHLAEDIGDTELRVDALFRRGGAYGDSGQISSALSNYKAAASHLKKVPHYISGGVLAELGHTEAQLNWAKGSDQILAALSQIDQAYDVIRKSKLSDDAHFLRLDSNRYHIDKAAALVKVRWYKG